MPQQLSPEQVKQYYASEGNKPRPLSPLDWLKQQQGGLAPLPQGGGAALPGETPSLPDTGGEESPLLSFASSLDAAVNLARQERNKSSLEMMQPFQGTVKASDFDSILSNLNRASDTTSQDLIKRATETTEPRAADISKHTNDAGVITGINDLTGEVVWQTKPGVGNQQGSAGGGGTTPKKGAHYTAGTIPNDVKADLIDDIGRATSLQQLYNAYPDVSTSYVSSLYNSLHKTTTLGAAGDPIDALIAEALGGAKPKSDGIDWSAYQDVTPK